MYEFINLSFLEKVEHMRKTFIEETVLFISIIKWAVLATLTGIVVGLSSTIIFKVIRMEYRLGSNSSILFFAAPGCFIFKQLIDQISSPGC